MFPNSRIGRAVTLFMVTCATLGLSACSVAPTEASPVKPPTMAPEQSLGEACGVSQAAVDELVADAESQLRAGLETAGQEFLRGRMPDFAFLGVTLDSSFMSLHDQITNAEVSAALGRVADAISGVGELEQPSSLLSVPAYLAGLKTQLGLLTQASNDLHELCGSQ